MSIYLSVYEREKKLSEEPFPVMKLIAIIVLLLRIKKEKKL